MNKFVLLISRVILILLCFSFILGCSNKYDKEACAKIDTVSKIVFENPDSALKILNSIDIRLIVNDNIKADYAMYLIMSRFKCRDFNCPDSLISIATDYYSYNYPKYKDRAMWSFYYKGFIMLLNNNPKESIWNLVQARELCEDKNYYALGHIYETMADAYRMCYNMATCITYRDMAKKNYIKSNRYDNAFFAANDLSKDYIGCGQIARAKDIIDSLDNTKLVGEQKALLEMSNIYLLMNQKKYSEALEIFRNYKSELNPEFLMPQYSVIANLYANNLLKDTAELYLNAYRKINPDYKNDSWHNATIMALDVSKNSTSKSYDSRIYRDSVNYQNLRRALDLNIALKEKEFYSIENEKHKYQVKTLWLTSAVCGLLVLICIISWLFYRKNQLLERSELELKLQELKQMLQDSEKTKNEIQQNNNRNKENINYKLLNALLAEEFETIKKECEEYFDKNISDKEKDALSISLRKRIKRINSNVISTKIEKLSDAFNDGIITSVKAAVPELSEQYIKYIIFKYAGCTNNLISLLLNTSPQYCRTIKSRLIKKIELKDFDGKERIISKLRERS